MKKLLLFVSFSFFAMQIFSQTAVANHEQIAKFYKTTTCVVLDDNIFNIYNSAIKTAVEQSWTITPYEFISMQEFKQRMNKPEYSFLVRTKVVPEKNQNNISYSFLTLVEGEARKSFNNLAEICSFPLSYYNSEYDDYDYKLSTLLLFIQNHIKITYDNPKLNNKNILQYYNRNITKVGTKDIYITKEDVENSVNSTSKISKFYSGKVNIVEAEDIEKVVNNKDNNAIILHIVAPDETKSAGRCYKMLVGVADGKLYYFDYHKVKNNKPAKFLQSDFAKIK